MSSGSIGVIGGDKNGDSRDESCREMAMEHSAEPLFSFLSGMPVAGAEMLRLPVG